MNVDKYIENKTEKLIKLKPGYVLRKIANSDVVIPIGDNIADFNGLFTLNETAAFLFKLISEGVNIPDMVNALINKYNINHELASKDVEGFISQLNKAEMLMDM